MLTIVIPCFNNEATVSAAVKSALAQVEVAVEVVVVDDGSTDGTVAVLESFGDSIQVLQQENSGACAARNRGWRAAQCEWVKFLDADDRLHPECLKQQLLASQRLGPRAISFGRADWVDPEGTVVGRFPLESLEVGAVWDLAAIIDHSPLTSCPLHRRSLLEEVGGFNESCPRGQEQDLHVRLAIHGVKFVYDAVFCYWYEQGDPAQRISAKQYQYGVCAKQLEIFVEHAMLAKERGLLEINPSLQNDFARNLWRHGRLCLRADHVELALHCFRQSRVISNSLVRSYVCGGILYRVMVCCFGPEVLYRLFKYR